MRLYRDHTVLKYGNCCQDDNLPLYRYYYFEGGYQEHNRVPILTLVSTVQIDV